MELNKSIKNALESIGSREDHMEEGIRGLENRNLEIILIEEKRELRVNKWKKNLHLYPTLLTAMLRQQVSRGEEKRAASLSKEIIAENFPNLGSELDIQVHWAKRTLSEVHGKEF